MYITTLRKRVYLTVLAWSLGCFIGSALATQSGLFSLMRSAMFCKLSLLGFLLTISTPFLFSYILCRYFGYLFVLPVVFLKSCSFSFFYFCISLAFGNAGWLVKWLLLFSDSLCVCLFLWFCFRVASDIKNVHQFTVCICFSTFIGCIDYFYILPIGEVVF